MNAKLFWNRTKALLRDNKITQKEAAEACGRSLSTFKGWMLKCIIPPLDDAFALARLLGVTLEFLITGRDKPNTPNLKIKAEVILLLDKAGRKLKDII